MRTLSKSVFLRLASIFVVCVLLAVGCGEEDGIGAGEEGDLEIMPRSVNFPPVIIGESFTETLELRNGAEDASIILRSLDLEPDTTQEGSHEVFEMLNPFEGEVELEPGESYEIDIEYTPEASEPYNALITFGTNIPEQTEVEVEVDAAMSEPELLAEDIVSFDRVPAGSEQWLITEVDNIGYADLAINDVTLSGAHEFDITFPIPIEEIDYGDLDEDQQQVLDDLDEQIEGDIADELDYAPAVFDRELWQDVIEPDEAMPLRLHYEAEDDDFRTATVTIASNAPNAQPSHPMAVTANSDAPCLELIEEEVDFQLASIGNTSHQTVTFRNCSSIAQTVVDDLQIGAMDGGDFDADADIRFGIEDNGLPDPLREGNVLALEPQQTFSIVVTYTPMAEEVDTATLYASSNDEASPLLADVRGEGADLECPIAEAEAAIAGSGAWSDQVFGIPLDVIELNGSDSYDPDGTQVTYEWSLADRPMNSTAQIDNPQSENPTLTADIAGRFVVELMVYDGAGIGACEAATVEVTIEPESAIHVELTWEVPAADDGTGTDLDLHYLHPNGTWSEEPWGVYYANPDPDWQDGSDITLDIDDLTGEEPENINHDDPDPAHDYATGVYYFGDPYNYGATDARVRIYLNSALFFEREQRLQTAGGTSLPGAGDFWYVGDVLVEGGGALDLDVYDELHEDAGFPDD